MRERKRSWLGYLGWGLVVVGVALLVWGGAQALSSGRRPSQVLPTSGPSPTTTVTATPTPEPIVPTATSLPVATETPRATVTDLRTSTVVSTSTPRPTLTASVVENGRTIETQNAPKTTPLPTTETPDSAVEMVVVTLAPSSTATSPPVTVSPTATDQPPATPTTAPVQGAGEFRLPSYERWRLGVSLSRWEGNPSVLEELKVGWVMDWHAKGGAPYGGVVDYAKTVRFAGGRLSVAPAALTGLAAGSPGALWLISNEPDVRWQDNVTADVYARLYHDAYSAIKAGDASAVVAAGGIAQPTPLRMKYLDQALQHYQAMYGTTLPANAWHIHNYMLHEERDSWGVDIPPGLAENTGVLYGISDSANLSVFKSQIVAFRGWMANRGYGGQPLVISEFGIPMPADYGFPPEVVAGFLQETTRYFITAVDGGLGDPTDGGRLVQRWCWFSLEYEPYPTGDLLDPIANRWTPLGYAWLSMVSE